MIRPTNLLFVAVFILVAISPPTYGNQNVIAMIGNTNAAADNIGPPPAMNCGNFCMEEPFAPGFDNVNANEALNTIARESKNAFAMVEAENGDLVELAARAAPDAVVFTFNSQSMT